MSRYTKYILVLVGLITTGISLYTIYKTGDFQTQGLTFLAGLTLLYGYLEIDKVDRHKEEAAKKKKVAEAKASKKA
ncbi:MAG: hypothetical protein AB8B53_10600 [Flavobacteriales bacterium]